MKIGVGDIYWTITSTGGMHSRKRGAVEDSPNTVTQTCDNTAYICHKRDDVINAYRLHQAHNADRIISLIENLIDTEGFDPKVSLETLLEKVGGEL